MASVERKSFDKPDETRSFQDDKGHVDLVNIGGGVVGLATFEPGWRWSEHVKPIAGTDSCQAAHFGYIISGPQTVRMDDGTELNFGPGDVIFIPPGHDGWTVGDEPCVAIDFAGMRDYAKGG
jgi:quercetin dioxygenase-like cupin family protein